MIKAKVQGRLFSLSLSISLLLFSLTQVSCVSGGFKLTRQYASFVNRQQVVIRVVLYLLTLVVFAATALIDVVIYNTMDFWEGRVSANSYEFFEGDKVYHVRHYHSGPRGLRNTEISIYSSEAVGALAPETLHLAEKDSGSIDIYKNGVLKATVRSLEDLPEVTLYEDGREIPWGSPRLIAKKIF